MLCAVFLCLPRSRGGTAWLSNCQTWEPQLKVGRVLGNAICVLQSNAVRTRMRQSVSHKVPYPSITTIHYSTSVQAMVGAELDSQIHPHPHTYIPRSVSRQEDEEVRERKKESSYVR
ncbi:hypothetical protein BC567DRAFT_226991 [Phyllosticta citribraziliensis]